VACDRIVGLDGEPASIHVGSQVGPADAQEQQRDVFVCAGKSRVQFNDAAIAFHRFVAPTLAAQQVGEVVPGLGIVWLLVGRVCIGELGGFLIVAGQQHVAEIVPRVCIVRSELQSAFDEVDGLVKPTLAHAEHAEVVEGIDVVRLLLQQVQVDGFRFLEPALLVVRERVVNGLGHGREFSKGGEERGRACPSDRTRIGSSSLFAGPFVN
jgi:hypothetical protein